MNYKMIRMSLLPGMVTHTRNLFSWQKLPQVQQNDSDRTSKYKYYINKGLLN